MPLYVSTTGSVGTGGIFGGKGVYLFHYGQNTCTLAQGTYGKEWPHRPYTVPGRKRGLSGNRRNPVSWPCATIPARLCHSGGSVASFHLVRLSTYLHPVQLRFDLHLFLIFVQRPAGVHYIHQLFKKPAVYFCQRVHLVYGISGTEGLGDNEDTLSVGSRSALSMSGITSSLFSTKPCIPCPIMRNPF